MTGNLIWNWPRKIESPPELAAKEHLWHTTKHMEWMEHGREGNRQEFQSGSYFNLLTKENHRERRQVDETRNQNM